MAESITVEQKCPACGAPLRFDPEKSKLVCDYCGTVTEILENAEEADGKAETEVNGFDFDSLLQHTAKEDPGELPVFNCKSCGAEILCDPETVSLTCPYCKNHIVLTGKVSGSLRPDGIIPFKISPKELPNAMKRFYSDKKLLPKDFFSEQTMDKINGVYVPFWVFTGRVSGRLNYLAERMTSHTRGEYIVTDTFHYRLERDVSMDFQMLPVDASEKLDDDLMDSLGPFDYNGIKPFDTRYLAGYVSERYDDAAEGLQERAKERMVNSTQDMSGLQAGAGYVNARPCGGSLDAKFSKVSYLLLPVYFFKINYRKKDYQFAVNGQTGKVIGDLPIGKRESRNYFLLRFGIAGAAAFALRLLIHFL